MKVYCEDSYKSFKDLMQTTYYAVCSNEKKNGFTTQDALMLQLFSLALEIQCSNLIKSIKKECEEDEK